MRSHELAIYQNRALNGLDRRGSQELHVPEAGDSHWRSTTMTTLAMRHARAPAVHASPHQYMVGGEILAIDWRMSNTPCWRMSSKGNGVRWDDEGSLSQKGREILLEHFGIQALAVHLPLEKIAAMSPAELFKKRRGLESSRHLDRLEPVSSRPGDHVPASLAA